MKDTNHALRILNEFRFQSETKFLFTMDVKSSSSQTFFLSHYRFRAYHCHFTAPTVAELALTLNCFSFDGRYFKQFSDVAMGTKMGPSYANSFVGFIKELIFKQHIQP